jgi:Domain of unknown function (DUF4880)
MPSHNNNDDELSQTRDQAAAWVSKMDSGVLSDAERVDLHEWLEEPRNSRALSEVRTLVGMISELPDKKASLLRRMPLKATFFGGGTVSVSSKIASPPGNRLAHAAKFLLTPNAYKRYVAPVIADMQQEYADAVAAGRPHYARWIALRVYLLIVPGWLHALVAGRLAALPRRGH